MGDELGKAKWAQLTEHAAAWLVALDAGTADPAAFEAWRDADPRHAVAFAEVATTWNELDRLRPLRSTFSTRRPIVSRRAVMSGAAAASVAAVAGMIAWPLIDEASAETQAGERRTVRLPGDSLVELNTRTRVRWRRSGSDRALILDYGEIALGVPEGLDYLVSGEATLSVSGGSYNIRRDGTRVELMGLSPGARVNNRPLPNDVVAVSNEGRVALQPARVVERERAQAWRRGEIVFSGESLAVILTEYNRYLERPLVLTAPELGQLRLGGRFASTDPQSFLAALVAGFPVDARDSGSGPIMIGRRKKRVGE